MNSEFLSSLTLIIEHKKGTKTSADSLGLPGTGELNMPVDHGFIEGYTAEDGLDLEVYTGSGQTYGHFKLRSQDGLEKTVMIMKVTKEELEAIVGLYGRTMAFYEPMDEKEFQNMLRLFRTIE